MLFRSCLVMTLSIRNLVEIGSTMPHTRLMIISMKPRANRFRRGRTSSFSSGSALRKCSVVLPFDFSGPNARPACIGCILPQVTLGPNRSCAFGGVVPSLQRVTLCRPVRIGPKPGGPRRAAIRIGVFLFLTRGRRTGIRKPAPDPRAARSGNPAHTRSQALAEFRIRGLTRSLRPLPRGRGSAPAQ